jgi:serine/threonine-protein kinase
MADIANESAGRSIGAYRVVKKIGEGGMGKVYIAEHELLGKKVAIKVLLPEHSQNPEIVQRFFNEARAATRINHPGIVEIYDFGHDVDGSAYIVMEALRGESLGARLERERVLSPQAAARLAKHIAGALGQAHREGIVHRDLKPDNIFVVPDPDVPGGERTKILDFGIAKLAEGTAAGVKTRAGAVIGTPTYMAPEQFRGAGAVDHRADIYALGVLLYEMLTGRPPFVAEGLVELMEAHMFEAPPPPRGLVPALSPELEQVVLRALAKQPEQRQATVEQLAAELAAAVGGVEELAAATPAGPQTVVLPPLRRAPDSTLGGAAAHAISAVTTSPASRRGRWLAAGGLAAVGLTAGIVLAVRSGSAPSGSAPPEAPDAAPAVSLPDAALAAPDAGDAPPDAAPAVAPIDAAPASDGAIEAPPDTATPMAPLRPRPRDTGSARPAPGACDRRIDFDCDGIPDVR